MINELKKIPMFHDQKYAIPDVAEKDNPFVMP